MKNNVAVYAGSFDPITNGHIDIIERALKIFENLHVVVAVHPTKNYTFTTNERINLIKEALVDMKHVTVTSHDGLISNYASKVSANVLIRGVRAVSDFDYEFHLATINQKVSPELETLFIPTGAKYFFINSSSIKELAKFKAEVTDFVPKNVAAALTKKFR